MRLGQIIGAKEVPKDMAHGAATRGPSVWLKSVPSIWRRYCFGGYGRMILPDVHKHPCPQEQRQGTLGISGCDRPALTFLGQGKILPIKSPIRQKVRSSDAATLKPGGVCIWWSWLALGRVSSLVSSAMASSHEHYSLVLSVVSRNTALRTSAPPNQPEALKLSFQKSQTQRVPSTGSRWQVTAARTRLMRFSPCP